MKKHLSLLLFALTLSVCSCMYFTSATWVNDHIDPDIRAELTPLNKKLFEGLYAKNTKAVKQLMSKGLLDTAGSKLDTVIKTIGLALQSNRFSVVDQFYTNHATLGSEITLKANKGNVNNYTIAYRALSSSSYAVLLKSEGMMVNIAVLAIYGKYSDGWKINILSANNYDILGKTAPEYYAIALGSYHKGDTIDAADNITMAAQVVRPGGKNFAYDDEDDMKSFYTSMVAEANANYHFPVVVKQIKTQPKIFAVNPQLIDSGEYKGAFYPVVKYKSAISFRDTTALRAENVALQKIIGTIFKGITQNKKIIIYRAFNELSDGKTPVKYYGFVQRLP